MKLEHVLDALLITQKALGEAIESYGYTDTEVETMTRQRDYWRSKMYAAIDGLTTGSVIGVTVDLCTECGLRAWDGVKCDRCGKPMCEPCKVEGGDVCSACGQQRRWEKWDGK